MKLLIPLILPLFTMTLFFAVIVVWAVKGIVDLIQTLYYFIIYGTYGIYE